MILPAISIRLFSVFTAEIDGMPVPAISRRKSQWLLALLALRLGKEVSREWLADTLWPNSPPEYALRNLRQSLSDDIRPALDTRASLLRTPTKSTLCLYATDVWVDVAAFNAAISSQKITDLEHAVSLYTGPLLEDTAEEWVVQGSACEEAFYAALEKLAADAMRRGDPGRSAGYLRRLVASDPLRENAQIALMKALAASGDIAVVRKLYRDLRVLLHRELNTEPSPSTRALYERLRKAPVDAGLSGTVITVADQYATMTPPSLSADAHHMPIPLMRLIGRENDVTEVVDRLRRGRLVTVTGPGGVGKTRLSIAVAEAVGTEFPNGIWFVELAALSEPELVANTVAQALQIKEQQGKTSTETLITALISRSLLLVLDNYEHLLDSCAKLTEYLLSRCAGVRILSTSREAMGIYGEWVYPLAGLEVPPLSELAVSTPSIHKPKNLTAHLSEYTAVQLFAERAAAQNRSFRFSELDALTIAEICVRLDGLPLAIEMAAARVRRMSLNEVQSRLSDRFGLLRSGSRMALPRQQTLQALIDWSYDLLNDSEQSLLRRLSVFAGQWTLEAAEAICHSDQKVSELLSSLVEKSLLVLHTEDGDMRFSMLESTRQYSLKGLAEAGELTTLRRRHAEYFLALAGETTTWLTGAGQMEWSRRVEVEHDNLRYALEWFRVDPEGIESGLQLTSAMAWFWSTHGYLKEAQHHFAAALARDSKARTTNRSQALMGAAMISFQMGDYAGAGPFYDECLEIRRELGDSAGTAETLSVMGLVKHEQGDHTTASCICRNGWRYNKL